MTLQSDIENDWQYIDGIEEVKVFPQYPNGSAIEGVKALQRAVNRVDSVSPGGIEPTDTTFHLWAATMPLPDGVDSWDVQQGWVIEQENHARWTIRWANYSPMTSRWRCVCRKQLQN